MKLVTFTTLFSIFLLLVHVSSMRFKDDLQDSIDNKDHLKERGIDIKPVLETSPKEEQTDKPKPTIISEVHSEDSSLKADPKRPKNPIVPRALRSEKKKIFIG